MYVDACAIIALLSDEPEAERVSAALASAAKRVTSPVAILEAVLGLARPDKFGLGAEAVETIVLEFLEARGIEIRDLPPASARSPCLFRPRIAIAPGMVSISATACIMPAPILSRADPGDGRRVQKDRFGRRAVDSSPGILALCGLLALVEGLIGTLTGS